MMRELLLQAIPDVEYLLALEPERLGAKLLFLLRKYKDRGGQLSFAHVCNSELFEPRFMPLAYPKLQEREATLALQEAWQWLEVQGLLLPEPDVSGPSSYRRFSRRAKRMESEEQFVSYEVGRRIPKDSLHPKLADKVWSAFMREDFDTAVLHAMKAVEIHVREAYKLVKGEDYVAADKDYGTNLVQAAFNPKNGPLTDLSVSDKGEREARMQLFRATLGSYKNPLSHRDLDLKDPGEVVELIMLANHLLRIVDARWPRAPIAAS